MPSAHTLGLKDDVAQAALRMFSDWDIDPVIWPRAGAGGATGHFSRLLNPKPLSLRAWGMPDDHRLRSFVPQLREAGFGGALLHRILVENPARAPAVESSEKG